MNTKKNRIRIKEKQKDDFKIKETKKLYPKNYLLLTASNATSSIGPARTINL
jgi:hypothetical protein